MNTTIKHYTEETDEFNNKRLNKVVNGIVKKLKGELQHRKSYGGKDAFLSCRWDLIGSYKSLIERCNALSIKTNPWRDEGANTYFEKLAKKINKCEELLESEGIDYKYFRPRWSR